MLFGNYQAIEQCFPSKSVWNSPSLHQRPGQFSIAILLGWQKHNRASFIVLGIRVFDLISGETNYQINSANAFCKFFSTNCILYANENAYYKYDPETKTDIRAYRGMCSLYHTAWLFSCALKNRSGSLV